MVQALPGTREQGRELIWESRGIMCTCESYLSTLINSRKKMRDPLAQNVPSKVEQPSTTLRTRRDGLSEHWAVRPACVHTSGGASKKWRRARFESSEGSSAHQTCSDARVRFEALIVTRANGTGSSSEAWSPERAPDPWGHFSVGRPILKTRVSRSPGFGRSLRQF